MARVVEQTIEVKFSKLVRDSANEEPVLISDDDLELTQSVVDKLNESDASRVVEIDIPED